MSSVEYPDKWKHVIADHAPRGWKIVFKPHMGPKGYFRVYGANWYRGLADFENKVIMVGHIESRYQLATYLHECGHVNLRHGIDCAINEYAHCEYEAEKYAIDALRSYGISVPREYIADARGYVASCIEAYPEVPQADEVLKFAYGKRWRDYT